MPDVAEVRIFICANCARSGKAMTSAGRARPSVPDFDLSVSSKQVVIPCAGRLQPEHVLRAFESGSSIVSIVACREDNCHYVEGSRRCALRTDFLRSILNEIGLGETRLLLSYLPGSASEDLAVEEGTPADPISADSLQTQLSDIRTQIIEALRMHSANPLRLSPDEEAAMVEESVR
jgi:F420-non-reducing hydrogenase iron-sulfur subunit